VRSGEWGAGVIPERTEPYTWVTDGPREWIGRLVHIRDDGKAVVVNAHGGRVTVGWTPWGPPPRVIAVQCADCEHPTAAADLVRGEDDAWLCMACEDRRARIESAMQPPAQSAADART
jgi:hypothetical protein